MSALVSVPLALGSRWAVLSKHKNKRSTGNQLSREISRPEVALCLWILREQRRPGNRASWVLKEANALCSFSCITSCLYFNFFPRTLLYQGNAAQSDISTNAHCQLGFCITYHGDVQGEMFCWPEWSFFTFLPSLHKYVQPWTILSLSFLTVNGPKLFTIKIKRSCFL